MIQYQYYPEMAMNNSYGIKTVSEEVIIFFFAGYKRIKIFIFYFFTNEICRRMKRWLNDSQRAKSLLWLANRTPLYV
jgi:hypothetical protein